MNSLMDLLEQTPFGSYCYAYPHKTAYRPFPEPIPIRRLWTDERRDALFLYLHVPFCPFRCGYCNLFSAASPDSELVDAYLEAIRRQAGQVRRSLGEASFAQLAIGGGTPTFLGVSRLERLLALARDVMGVASPTIPML